MVNDKNQKPFDTVQSKSSTIDDLVKELSKDSSSNQTPLSSPTANQGPPPNLPGVKIEDKPPVSPVSMSKPVTPIPSIPPSVAEQVKPFSPSPPSRSQAVPSPTAPSSTSELPNPPPRPQSTPTTSSPLKPSPVQEYRSSIRTMNEDIASIKSGQKPSGVDIPRKIAPDTTRPPISGVPKLEASLSTGPKSAVGLGRAEKTGPLPFTPAPKGSEIPKPPTIQPHVIVPKENKRFLSPRFYMIVAGGLVIVGFLYWFFVLRIPGMEVATSPTPSPTLTATPTVKNFNEIFGESPVNFEISSTETAVDDFKTFVKTLNVPKYQFSLINLMEDKTNTGMLVPISLFDMLDMVLTVYPAGLKENIIDSVILVYGQSEIFSPDGTLNFNAQDLKKISFVARVKNKTMTQAIMADWELTIADDLAEVLFIADTSKEASANFLGNIYRGVAIKYKNFPFPDATIDYAMVEMAGQNYLVITGSREAMYVTVDILLGQ